MLKLFATLLISSALILSGCSGDKKADEAAETKDGTTQSAKEPDIIVVQHILIGFEGSVPGKPITRDKEEAARVAAFVLKQAQIGEDFAGLVRQYTDDTHPGIYKMANFGVPGDVNEGIFPRGQMVAAFGDVGFPLEVGGIGMASYDTQTSPFGWHIIKRIE